MGYDNIPLTTVRSAASSTGARKQGEGTDLSDMSASQNTFTTDNEKKGFFKKRPGPAGRRKSERNKPKRTNSEGEEISVNGLGRFYDKIVNFSVVTRYFVYVAPIALLIAAPIIIYSTGDRHNDYFINTKVKVNWFWLWIEIVWLSIWVSKLAAQAVPWVFMFVCCVVSSGTRKYALILKAVEIPLSLVGWSVACLLTFKGLTSNQLNQSDKVRPKGSADPGWIGVMVNLLAPAVIASLIFLGEKCVVQLISINYHRRSFDGRIKESKHNIHLLGLLYDASRTLFPMYCREFMEEDYIINDGIEAMIAKTTGNQMHQSGSATPLKLIGDIGRVGDKVT